MECFWGIDISKLKAGSYPREMDEMKAYILFPGAQKNPLYSGWMEDLSLPVEIVRDYNVEWTPPADAGILITHSHYRWEELSILKRVKEQGIVPILILADGILEYRNSFRHPDLADGSMFQPLLGHKLACLGESQIRWIEAWGNVGQCELVGLPRLDYLLQEPERVSDPNGPFRILIATARTPWFDEEQRQLTYEALESIKSFTDQCAEVMGRPLQVVWRMAEELHLNLQAPGYETRPQPIRKTLAGVDAVITTPSTLQLEAAAMGLPVAVVDFHNSPQMTPLAWTITHPSQIASVFNELACPSPAMRFMQNALLHDALQLHQPAAERMKRLVEVMVTQGRQSRQDSDSINLPARILEHPSNGFCMPQPSAARERLFPDNPLFSKSDVLDLQTELAAAVKEMGNYPEKYFRQRTLNQHLRGYINWLRLLIRNRAATIEELSIELQKQQEKTGDSGRL